MPPAAQSVIGRAIEEAVHAHAPVALGSATDTPAAGFAGVWSSFAAMTEAYTDQGAVNLSIALLGLARPEDLERQAQALWASPTVAVGLRERYRPAAQAISELATCEAETFGRAHQ